MLIFIALYLCCTFSSAMFCNYEVDMKIKCMCCIMGCEDFYEIILNILKVAHLKVW